MKKFIQTKFGNDGNCFAACVASILEVDIKSVDYPFNENNWFTEYAAQLYKEMGIVLIGAGLAPDMAPACYGGAYVIVTGKNRKNTYRHAAVATMEKYRLNTAFEIVHDPMGRTELDMETVDTVFLLTRNSDTDATVEFCARYPDQPDLLGKIHDVDEPIPFDLWPTSDWLFIVSRYMEIEFKPEPPELPQELVDEFSERLDDLSLADILNTECKKCGNLLSVCSCLDGPIGYGD